MRTNRLQRWVSLAGEALSRVYLPLAVLVMLVPACSGAARVVDEEDATTGVRVASFDFAESELVAELYARILERHGVAVHRLGTVGPREIVAPALEGGLIDVVPEYLGTASAFYAPVVGEALDVRVDMAERGLTLLVPSTAQNVNVFVVSKEIADRHNLERLSDLGDLAAEFRFGGPVECRERQLCLVGLRDVYGLQFAEFVPQSSLRHTAEALARDEIDVGVMFSTAGELLSGPFSVLEDDQGLQPQENLVPLVRLDAIDRWGTVVETSLNELSAQLATVDVMGLNRRVTEGIPVEVAAEQWLNERGLGRSGE